MIETDDGNYEKYTDGNTWPTGYVFNEMSLSGNIYHVGTITCTYSG